MSEKGYWIMEMEELAELRRKEGDERAANPPANLRESSFNLDKGNPPE